MNVNCNLQWSYGQRGEIKRNYKDDDSLTAGQLGDNWSGPYEIQRHIETDIWWWFVEKFIGLLSSMSNIRIYVQL